MIDDYMPIRLDLPDDAKVLRIAQLTKLHKDLALGKLVRVWAWAQKHSVDGSIHGELLSVDAVADARGFGEAMHRVGWMKVIDDDRIAIPNWNKWNSHAAKKRAFERDKKRKTRGQMSLDSGDKLGTNVPGLSQLCPQLGRDTIQEQEQEQKQRSVLTVNKSKISGISGTEGPSAAAVSAAPDPADRICVSVEDCSHLAERAFRRTGYTGDDGSLIWRLAALARAGRIPEAIFHDAAEGCAAKTPRNVPGYFRRIVAAKVPDLRELLKAVWLVPSCPTGPPPKVRVESIINPLKKPEPLPTQDD